MKSWSVLTPLLALASQGVAVVANTPASSFRSMGFQNIAPPLDYDEAIAEIHGNQSKLSRRDVNLVYFDQLIDHSNPSLGTFKQRYWWDTTYYRGPGSPIIVMNNGEIAADRYLGYLTNRSINGLIAQDIGAAIILFEHRYWGQSAPVQNLTVHNLRYLTLNNSLADNTYFANNVKLSFDPEGKSHPSKAPWILVGGSYAGALSAWVQSVYPGTFWAYYASSAVVEAIGDYYGYYDVVRKGMPQNCSADVVKVIEHVDDVLLTGSPEEKLALKTKFGFADLEYDSDFASAITNPISWQNDDYRTGYSAFYKWCDYVENAIPDIFPGTPAPTPEGVGLERALEGYAKYVRENTVPDSCNATIYGNNSLACWNSHNATDVGYTDISINGIGDRAWRWMTCDAPFKWWQGGAPKGQPTIVSRLVDVKYAEDICALYYPAETVDGVTYKYGIAQGLDVDNVNKFTNGGWFHTNSTRVLHINGEFDPWREASLSSVHRPGGEVKSTEQLPVLMIPNGRHCFDLITKNGDVNDGVRKVQVEAISIMKKWVEEFPGYKPL